jgi:hypothetical protein
VGVGEVDSQPSRYETPEEAACADIPPQFATVVGARISGETATVWLLTNDQPPFEPYEVHCERDAAGWGVDSGYGGFGRDVPAVVLERARALGWAW